MLKINEAAPDFELQDADGKSVKLSGFRGKPVVLYFYPKDDTPGCTKEACSFRDSYDDFLALGAAVIGVSKDGAESHKKFAKKYGLPFHLLSDPEHRVMETYGAWGEKTMYGKKVTGTIRSTVLIGADGVIRKVWPKVSPEAHASEVLEALRALG